ncbi:hypothetical protein HK104_008087 [Borealophlyctis nickersoniae]|nr:hypothetical protein HK104_008087 [Borealophlyctis nickersoniae]
MAASPVTPIMSTIVGHLFTLTERYSHYERRPFQHQSQHPFLFSPASPLQIIPARNSALFPRVAADLFVLAAHRRDAAKAASLKLNVLKKDLDDERTRNQALKKELAGEKERHRETLDKYKDLYQEREQLREELAKQRAYISYTEVGAWCKRALQAESCQLDHALNGWETERQRTISLTSRLAELAGFAVQKYRQFLGIFAANHIRVPPLHPRPWAPPGRINEIFGDEGTGDTAKAAE